ncbi:hypothetical protein KKB07_01590, partial [bacterium]|nr:hypothetical protein [bacterium]
LKKYGIPPYTVNIWEKYYSRDLLPLQEEAVRNYGILSCGEGSGEIAALSSKVRNDRGMDSRFRGNDREDDRGRSFVVKKRLNSRCPLSRAQVSRE